NGALAQANADTNKAGGAQTNPLSPLYVQPNIDAVRAPQAWAQGYDGAGVVISSMGSGVRWTHEALSARYRGTLDPPDPANIHDYNWYDGYLSSDVPIDESGSGTFDMGILTGNSPNPTYGNIGVAPGAM